MHYVFHLVQIKWKARKSEIKRICNAGYDGIQNQGCAKRKVNPGGN